MTLRTAAGLDCIRAIAGDVEGANVGAGTVLDARQYEDAAKAGAKFIVSPGATPGLVAAAKDSAVPFLPGVATAGEAMTLAEAGFTTLKFFPAEPAGGLAYLKALSAPAAGDPLLPDRRDHAEERTGLSGARQRDLRWRVVGGAGRCAGRRRLGENHRAVAGSGPPSRLGLRSPPAVCQPLSWLTHRKDDWSLIL